MALDMIASPCAQSRCTGAGLAWDGAPSVRVQGSGSCSRRFLSQRLIALSACRAQVPEEQRGELCQAHEEELTAQYEAEAAATRPPQEAAVQRSAEEASVLKQCALHPNMLCSFI